MKKAILLFPLLLLILSAGAQTIAPINTFLGIKFGASPATVLKEMQLKGGIPDNKSTKKNYYVFTNVKYGSRKTEYVYFRFSDDKLFEGGAYFRPDPPQLAIIQYNSIKNEISTGFGEGEDRSRLPTSYSQGENETTAIELGNALYLTRWVEDARLSYFNSIELTINPDLYTHLRFTQAKQGRQK